MSLSDNKKIDSINYEYIKGDTDDTDEIPFTRACLSNNYQLVDKLIDTQINNTNWMGCNALETLLFFSYSFSKKRYKMCDYLIKKGADIECIDHNTGSTLLMRCVEDHLSIKYIDLLISNGADINATDNKNNKLLTYLIVPKQELDYYDNLKGKYIFSKDTNYAIQIQNLYV